MASTGSITNPKSSLADTQSQPNGHAVEPTPAQPHDHTHSHEEDPSGGGR